MENINLKSLRNWIMSRGLRRNITPNFSITPSFSATVYESLKGGIAKTSAQKVYMAWIPDPKSSEAKVTASKLEAIISSEAHNSADPKMAKVPADTAASEPDGPMAESGLGNGPADPDDSATANSDKQGDNSTDNPDGESSEPKYTDGMWQLVQRKEDGDWESKPGDIDEIQNDEGVENSPGANSVCLANFTEKMKDSPLGEMFFNYYIAGKGVRSVPTVYLDVGPDNVVQKTLQNSQFNEISKIFHGGNTAKCRQATHLRIKRKGHSYNPLATEFCVPCT